MSATPEEMMVCAEGMLPVAANEAQYRSTCNRAYYAAYNAARTFHNALATPGLVGQAKGRHQQLIAQLLSPQISAQNKKHAISKAIGKSMIPLLDARILSDYHIHLNVDQPLANTTVQGSRVVVDQAK